MMRFLQDLGVVLGRNPQRPKEISGEARKVMAAKRARGVKREDLLNEIAAIAHRHKWRNRRWAVVLSINLLFTVSFWLDIQVLEGSLTASRFLGFHLADPYSSLLIMLAQKHVAVNLMIGAITAMLLWGLLGGRTFCSWACPYHLVSEWAEQLHLRLAKRGIVRDHALHRGVRSLFWIVFGVMALATGQLLFLTLNPIGMLSRAVIYGPGLALGWVAVLLLFEVVYSRRAWCRYVCPIGLTYGFLGLLAPLRVQYHLDACAHEGECRKVCMVPHVLNVTIRGRAQDVDQPIGADCTRCGMCLDACPTGALTYEIRGLKQLL